MATLKALVTFVFTIFCVKFIVAAAICDSKDDECSKARAKEAYALFISGIDNLVESSDPITMGLVKASLPTIKYELRNYKMTGLKRCDVTLMSVLKTNSSFQFHLHCPSLVVNADYTLLGHIEDNNMFVEGEGKFTVKLDDYILMINGIYELISGNDDKKHVHIKNYFIEVNPRGKVVFNFENMFGGDKEKSDAFNDYLNQHWSEMDKALRAPALYTLMDAFIANLNKFLAILPVEQIFPEHAQN